MYKIKESQKESFFSFTEMNHKPFYFKIECTYIVSMVSVTARKKVLLKHAPDIVVCSHPHFCCC